VSPAGHLLGELVIFFNPPSGHVDGDQPGPEPGVSTGSTTACRCSGAAGPVAGCARHHPVSARSSSGRPRASAGRRWPVPDRTRPPGCHDQPALSRLEAGGVIPTIPCSSAAPPHWTPTSSSRSHRTLADSKVRMGWVHASLTWIFASASCAAPGVGDRPEHPEIKRLVAEILAGHLGRAPEAGPCRRQPAGRYYGLSHGGGVGMHLVAAEPRITAAVLGLDESNVLIGIAPRITIPVEFVMQREGTREIPC
jgi:hypothetical protein